MELLTSFAAGSTYSKAKFRFKIAVWIARCHRPFNLVEDPEFREILAMLYGRVEVPSRKSVARDVLALVNHAKQELIARLEVCTSPCKICELLSQFSNNSAVYSRRDPSVC